ncbi:MAG: glutathione S-transferase [Rhodobacteraceae bacterium]|nr:glutathione S-transferase [Paracoccaceae bacterium]
MKYDLAISDKTYSSWSLRGWLLFAKFNIPVTCHSAKMYHEEFAQMLSSFQPARLVPAMKFDGIVVTDTLAMAETLAEQNPDANMWPADAAARALARSLCAEMHAGFGAMRNDCPMNLRRYYPDFQPTKDVQADAKRAEYLWGLARSEFRASGPWLFGDYSIADVFYAPLATRFATYNLPRNPLSDAYIHAHLADEKFRQWRAMGFAQNYSQPGYDKDLPSGDWPGPTPITAKAVETGPAENANCPYSGKKVTDFLEVDGRVFGMCNPFCRNKTLADPTAWPEFLAIYQK